MQATTPLVQGMHVHVTHTCIITFIYVHVLDPHETASVLMSGASTPPVQCMCT